MEEGRREEGVKQQHDAHHRRLNPVPEAHHQPPQKCPRCDSFNTKFCYYNNYSLSQPRYFCKTCRRYWTQGGTLRNVPVGGGCRKGKKAKASSSSSSGGGSSPPQQPPHDVQVPQNLPPNLADHHLTSVPPPMSSYYSGGGFLSSLSAMQSLNNQPQAFNQPLNVGVGQFGGSSNLALLQGINSNNNYNNAPSFSSQLQAQNQQIQHQSEQNLYPSDQALVLLPNRSVGRYSWNQTLGNNSTAASHATASFNPRASGTYPNPSQWSDQSGYGHPP